MKTFRPAQPTDLPLIYATWLRSIYYGSPYFKLIDKEIFFENYKAIATKRLTTNNVTVCCLTEDPDVVLGYAVHSGETLHWVYVKRAWREFGIAKQLVGDCKVTTSMTKIGRFVNKDRMKFNPFIG